MIDSPEVLEAGLLAGIYTTIKERLQMSVIYLSYPQVSVPNVWSTDECEAGVYPSFVYCERQARVDAFRSSLIRASAKTVSTQYE